ncbi:MAG: HD domain-containing protein [Phocaeicola sp.]
MSITFEEIKKSEEIRTYIKQADESLKALGYTEHGFAHCTKCADTAKYILSRLNYDNHTITLAQIAGYMHDIGNVINRTDHAQSGAVMAFRILDKMGFDPKDTATVITAIGNHDESTAFPVNEVAAALILADKLDVRRSRVRDKKTIDSDIHDRVNYAAEKTEVRVDTEQNTITLMLTVDTQICSVTDYFEIFLQRMLLCTKAANVLKLTFKLNINDSILL